MINNGPVSNLLNCEMWKVLGETKFLIKSSNANYRLPPAMFSVIEKYQLSIFVLTEGSIGHPSVIREHFLEWEAPRQRRSRVRKVGALSVSLDLFYPECIANH